MVEEALRQLPEEFHRYFSNMTVVVEDYPTKDEAGLVGVPRDELLGMFSGTAYPHKDGLLGIPDPMPDRVVLFRRNLEAVCNSEEELIEEIGLTVAHEIGHYFGLSEEDLLEYEWPSSFTRCTLS